MDNRISLYAAQYGKCAVTGKELWINKIHCHHKIPLQKDGSDKYENLVIIHRNVHLLIHATELQTITTYLNLIQPDKKALERINSLRLLAGNASI